MSSTKFLTKFGQQFYLCSVEGVLSFKVGQAEDNVISIGDSNAQALEEEAKEVRPSISGLDRRVVRCQGEADMNFERRQMQKIEEVFLTL